MNGSRVPGDPELLPMEELEVVRGPRTATSAGERLMIALAAVALLGGLLIALGNVLPDSPGVSEASPPAETTATPRPTRTPRPTATPRPLREIALEPVDPPAEEPFEVPMATWIRARADLPIRALPSEDSPQTGTLAAGEVAYAEGSTSDNDEWLAVRGGWVRVEVDGEVRVDGLGGVVSGPYPSGGGDISPLLTDGELVLAMGWLNDGGFFTAISRDGSSWRRAQIPLSPWTSALIAWGPAGWLMATGSPDGDGVHLQRSDDARAWESLGRLRDPGRQGPTIGWPERLVASELGYLLTTSSGDGSVTHWYSPDGGTWLETERDQVEDAYPVLTAGSPFGFLSWGQPYGPFDEASPGGSFMVDGRRWRPVEGGPRGFVAEVAAVGDGLLGVDGGYDGEGTRVWRGQVEGRNLSWVRDESAEHFLDDVIVTVLSSDGDEALVAGWRRGSGESVIYLTDGERWTPVSPPPADEGGGYFSDGLMGPDGPILVGRRVTLRGDFPVIWSLGANGRWTRSGENLVPEPPELTPEACPAPPDDAFEFVLLDPADAITCFGDTPLTFRAWVEACERCGSDGMGFDPSWFAPDSDSSLYVMPVESEVAGSPYSTILHPDAVIEGELDSTWAELTGHFADPAARDCRVDVAPGEAWFYPGLESLVHQCMRTFVVTEARVVDGREG